MTKGNIDPFRNELKGALGFEINISFDMGEEISRFIRSQLKLLTAHQENRDGLIRLIHIETTDVNIAEIPLTLIASIVQYKEFHDAAYLGS
jgi:hypothetical protein